MSVIIRGAHTFAPDIKECLFKSFIQLDMIKKSVGYWKVPLVPVRGGGGCCGSMNLYDITIPA